MIAQVHYAPGERPLCGAGGWTACYTDDPTQVPACVDYRGRCLHCRQEITALGGVEWRRVVRAPCPHCNRRGW